MGLHIIIGRGNLGLDIQAELLKAGHDARLFTKHGEDAHRWEWPESEPNFFTGTWEGAECVWCCAGGYSVASCEDIWSLPDATESLFELPVGLALALPRATKLVVFSTDYVADPFNPSPGTHTAAPRSIYACLKIAMEDAIMSTRRPGTLIARIGSLYGGHFPERTFPGKLAKNYPQPCELRVPGNFVTPTPSWWIAEKIVASQKQLFGNFPRIEHIAPWKGCTLLQWAKAVLGPQYEITAGDMDEARPNFSQIGMSFSSGEASWRTLWTEHLKRWPEFPGHRT